MDVESCSDPVDYVDIESDDVPMDAQSNTVAAQAVESTASTDEEDDAPNNDPDLDDEDNDPSANPRPNTTAATSGRRRPFAPPHKLERSAAQVLTKINAGCECNDNCYAGLQADAVFRHRLNVAELTREEHDMYLMGVTMACLANPEHTHRNRERQRQRASYVYKGKRVCLDAFLYLENVTQYQLKRIRQHVMQQGVVPRVHGNMGKKPHNTFSLDMYKCAEHFVRQSIAQHHHTPQADSASSSSSTGNTVDAQQPTAPRPSVVLVSESRTSMYEKFKKSALHPDGKIMGYTTFRHFIKKQFPNVRFAQHCRDAAGGSGGGGAAGSTPKRTGKTKARS